MIYGEAGAPVEQFVSFFANEIFDTASYSTKSWLMTAEGFTDLKAFLFVVFRTIDCDEDGSASWAEVVEYLIDERIAATQAFEDAEQRWVRTAKFRFSTQARPQNVVAYTCASAP